MLDMLESSRPVASGLPIGELAEAVRTVHPGYSVKDVKAVFEGADPFHSVVVAEDRAPVGLVMAYNINRMLSTQYGMSLYYERAVRKVMDNGPLIVDFMAPLAEVAQRAMQRTTDKLYDHVIVTRDGFVEGVVSVRRITERLATLHGERAEDLARVNTRLEKEIDERREAQARLRNAFLEIDTANKNILESIQYAKHIQQSILVPEKRLPDFGLDGFVLWSPRDIVGGDYYLLREVRGRVFAGVMDCTGHGVPGALLTMVVYTNLRRILAESPDLSPALVLAELNSMVKRTLRQEQADALSDDGLDAALCVIEPDRSRLTFAGARLSLVAVSNGEASVIKGDRKSIGYKNAPQDQSFTDHSISLRGGAQALYMFSDGLPGQVGGAKGMPFGNKRLVQILSGNHKFPMRKQKEKLLKSFEEYKGENETRDDLTVMGFRVKP